MENQTVTHITLNNRYRIVIERAASTKGVDGYKIEANSDTMEEVVASARYLKEQAEKMTTPIVSEAKEK